MYKSTINMLARTSHLILRKI